MIRPGARQYALRMMWGNLETRDSNLTAASGCPVTDWSGSVETEDGMLIVRRLLRFEPGDSIVRPRKGPHRVEWISHTRDHVDGIQLKIVVPPHGSAEAADGFLTISTPFYKMSSK